MDTAVSLGIVALVASTATLVINGHISRRAKRDEATLADERSLRDRTWQVEDRLALAETLARKVETTADAVARTVTSTAADVAQRVKTAADGVALKALEEAARLAAALKVDQEALAQQLQASHAHTLDGVALIATGDAAALQARHDRLVVLLAAISAAIAENTAKTEEATTAAHEAYSEANHANAKISDLNARLLQSQEVRDGRAQ